MVKDEFFVEDSPDSNETIGLDEKALGELAVLANRQLALEAQIKETDTRLAELKRQLYTLSAEDIPQMMAAIGVKEFMLDSGERLKVRRVIKASIPEKHKAAALKWLRENNAGSLIKNEVITSFGRGEDKNAIKLLKALQKRGLKVSQKEGVHGNTLSAFCREQLETGVELPAELLGLFEYMETKITKA